MGVLLGVLTPFRVFNSAVLWLARYVAALALGIMVVVILLQVFFRYTSGSWIYQLINSGLGEALPTGALPWPDEAARFMMLWMTGLIAPAAYRQGGFVAIDMLTRALPHRISASLTLILLSFSLLVLIVGIGIGYSEVTGFSGRFATASLYLPTAWDFSEFFRIPRSWMMASLLVGFVMLAIVNVELIIRQIITLIGGADRLPAIAVADLGGAE